MPREKQSYRDLLERLDAVFDHELLTHAEVARWLGIGMSTMRRRYAFPQGRIPKTTVAREVAE